MILPFYSGLNLSTLCICSPEKCWRRLSAHEKHDFSAVFAHISRAWILIQRAPWNLTWLWNADPDEAISNLHAESRNLL
jgi:hypothetical protein